MAEKRLDLIDRQAFIDDVKTEIMNLYLNGMKGTPRPRGELYDLIDRINEQPAVDAVEVVRCSECRYSRPPAILTQKYGKPGTLTCKNIYSPCNHRNVNCADFCSYGEREYNTDEQKKGSEKK